MSRRVALGALGTDSSVVKYGLRVSRPTTDAVPAASTSATVSIDDLRFENELEYLKKDQNDLWYFIVLQIPLYGFSYSIFESVFGFESKFFLYSFGGTRTKWNCRWFRIIPFHFRCFTSNF